MMDYRVGRFQDHCLLAATPWTVNSWLHQTKLTTEEVPWTASMVGKAGIPLGVIAWSTKEDTRMSLNKKVWVISEYTFFSARLIDVLQKAVPSTVYTEVHSIVHRDRSLAGVTTFNLQRISKFTLSEPCWGVQPQSQSNVIRIQEGQPTVETPEPRFRLVF